MVETKIETTTDRFELTSLERLLALAFFESLGVARRTFHMFVCSPTLVDVLSVFFACNAVIFVRVLNTVLRAADEVGQLSGQLLGALLNSLID